jgi:protein-export membrane protein SecD
MRYDGVLGSPEPHFLMPKLSTPARGWWTLGAIVLLTTWAFAYSAPTKWNELIARPGLSWLQLEETPFRLGLDLKGGTHLIYEADTSEVPQDTRGSIMEGVRDVIERRVNALGVAEPIVQLTESEGSWRLIVELAGVYDTDRAIATIGETPVLEFRIPRGTPPESTPEQQEQLDQLNKDERARAEGVLDRVAAGEDFAGLATQFSEDPGSAVQGGDLGWFTRGRMVPEFETAVFDALEQDEYTRALVETQFGWHIIKKTGMREVAAGAGVDATSITAIGEDGEPVAIDFSTEGARVDEEEAPREEVRASHILVRKTTTQDLLGIDARWEATDLGGRQLERAYVQFDQTTNQPEVGLEFDDEGAELLEKISETNIGGPLGIFIDGKSPMDTDGDGRITDFDLYAPTIQSKLTGGSARITGNLTVVTAKQLANRLQAGALPIPIEIISQTTVGPTLGKASVDASVRAVMIGTLLVALFMLLYYRLPGLASVIALGVYGLLVMAVLKYIGATLTLAGIAGFVMSLGMAVDANVLILERLREEIRAGRSLLDAVTVSMKRAWTSIRDANMTTLITSFILASLSSSVVKGFAITLAVGILVSLFTAMVVTRVLLTIFGRYVTAEGWYGVRRTSK